MALQNNFSSFCQVKEQSAKIVILIDFGIFLFGFL